ncbi:MAG: FimB/Mfa2 family fimbrial subunit [Mediterranea sp.]|nr:FimB/Mfa2 family fimbrial subunit [Mediterranea sp.]
MSPKYIVSVILGILLVYTSCVNEDTAECHQSVEVTLTLDSLSIDTGGEVEADDIDTLKSVYLYIIGPDHEIVKVRTFDFLEVGETYTLDVNVPPGLYDFVIWTSQESPFGVNFDAPGMATTRVNAEDALFRLDIPDDERITYLIPRMFYGRLEQVLVTGEDQKISIPLVENTNTIYLTVDGLPVCSDNYEYRITASDGNYYFDNSFARCDTFCYATTMRFEPGETSLNGMLRKLKLDDSRSPKLCITDITTGEQLYPCAGEEVCDLVKLIRQAYRDDPDFSFDTHHTFHITLTFDVNMAVTVGVDHWVSKNKEEDLM